MSESDLSDKNIYYVGGQLPLANCPCESIRDPFGDGF